MSIEQYKNNTLLVLDKYLPNYVIPFSFFENNNIEFENVLFMFYSIISNDNYFNAKFYHSLSFENIINNEDILKRDFCGFSPNGVIIFKTTEEKAEKLITELKSTPLFKNHYSDCL